MLSSVSVSHVMSMLALVLLVVNLYLTSKSSKDLQAAVSGMGSEMHQQLQDQIHEQLVNVQKMVHQRNDAEVKFVTPI